MTKGIQSNGIKPIIPYQRIAERKKPVQERLQRDKDNQQGVTEHHKRRFIAMRNLINRLKKDHLIQRVNYMSAEQEIRELGLATIKKNLSQLLSELGLSNNATTKVVSTVDDHTPLLQLKNSLSPPKIDHTIYPDVEYGLQSLNLELPEISLPMIDFSCVIVVNHEQNKPITSTLSNLYITINSLDETIPATPRPQSFQLSVSIASGVIEIDTTGRRTFVYQRADKSFGLYADKQINLEI